MADLKNVFIDTSSGDLREVRKNDSFKDLSVDDVDDISDLIGRDGFYDGQGLSVFGYYSRGDEGGGVFYWNDSESKSNHDGGTIINPDHNSTIGSSNWYSASGDSTDTSGTGCWVRSYKDFVSVKDFGAKGDGTNDDTKAIQMALDEVGSVIVSPPDSYYRITDTIVVDSSQVFKGINASWTSGDSISEIRWDGASDGVMVRVAQESLGTQSSTAVSSVKVKDLKLEGNSSAGVGLFCNYVTNESQIENITARNCNLFGILAGKLWYSVFRDLTARNCDGIGIAFSYDYENTFDDLAVNGVLIENIRASDCGQAYHADNAPTGFSTTSNLKGGCGIYVKLSTSSQIINAVSEGSYAAGITVDNNGLCQGSIDGIYTENNAKGARDDGEFSSETGMFLLNDSTNRSSIGFQNVYIHNDEQIYHYDNGGDCRYYFDELKTINITGNTTNLTSINIREGIDLDIDGGVSKDRFLKNLTLTPNGFEKTSSSGEAQHDGIFHTKVYDSIDGWASGAELDLFNVELRPNFQRGSISGASILLNLNISVFDDDTDVNSRNMNNYCTTFLVNMTAEERYGSGVTDNDVNIQASELGTPVDYQGGGDILDDNISLTFNKNVSDDQDRVNVEVKISITSSGDQSYNSLSYSAMLLGGATNNAVSPQLN